MVPLTTTGSGLDGRGRTNDPLCRVLEQEPEPRIRSSLTFAHPDVQGGWPARQVPGEPARRRRHESGQRIDDRSDERHDADEVVPASGHDGPGRQADPGEQPAGRAERRLEPEEDVGGMHERLAGRIHVLVIEIEEDDEILHIPQRTREIVGRAEQPRQLTCGPSHGMVPGQERVAPLGQRGEVSCRGRRSRRTTAVFHDSGLHVGHRIAPLDGACERAG